MKPTQVALYARVSSEQQNEARTIESQVADLRTRIAATGVALPSELEFVDNGYSGATLIRPALERLRDVAAAGGIDQVYVHCPDRLARNYAHQVLLLEEFLRVGVEVVFLNREVGQTPEDQLLLQGSGLLFGKAPDGRAPTNGRVVMLDFTRPRCRDQFGQRFAPDAGKRKVNNIGVAEEVIKERFYRSQRVRPAQLKQNYPHTARCLRHPFRFPRTGEFTLIRAESQWRKWT